MPSPQQSGAPPLANIAARLTLLEPLALVLLSLATVGTAWCSFQTTTWGGLSQRLTNLSATAARHGAAHQLQSQQMTLLDVLLFSEYINAHAAANEDLARFYSDRFRGEAKAAFAAWMATRPFENPQAPPHPFVPELYKPHLLEQARAEDAESLRLWQQAGEAGRTSRSYALITVLLASALFCGGTAPRFGALWGRRSVLAVGLAAFLFAIARLLLLPVQV